MMSEETNLDDHHSEHVFVKNPKASDKKLSSSAGEILILDSREELSLHSESKKAPRRRIHFSDGVIEEYSSSSEDDEEQKVSPEEPSKSAVPESPKNKSWIPWMLYYISFSGCSTLRMAESLGEKLGWFFGITSPKYYYEIEEFKRTKKQEEEAKSKEAALNWNAGPKDQTVITLDPKKLPSTDFTELSLGPKDED